jgi:hypothetical protein
LKSVPVLFQVMVAAGRSGTKGSPARNIQAVRCVAFMVL